MEFDHFSELVREVPALEKPPAGGAMVDIEQVLFALEQIESVGLKDRQHARTLRERRAESRAGRCHGASRRCSKRPIEAPDGAPATRKSTLSPGCISSRP